MLKLLRVLVTVKVPSGCAVSLIQYALPLCTGAGGAPGPNAPPAPVHNGKAYWIKLSAQADGSFTVTNARNNFSKTYMSKP